MAEKLLRSVYSVCVSRVLFPCAQARARELVDAALGDRDPASITRVRLSNKSYSAEAAKVIGEALEKMTSVTEVRALMVTVSTQGWSGGSAAVVAAAAAVVGLFFLLRFSSSSFRGCYG